MLRRLKVALALTLCLLVTVASVPLSASAAVYGDLNGDNKMNTQDALLLFNNASGTITLSSSQKIAADLNEDSRIDMTDAAMLYQKASGVDTGPVHPHVRAGITSESTYMKNIKVVNKTTGKTFTGSTKANLQKAVAEVVKYEVGMSTFGRKSDEAWKAFAVAAYTLLAKHCYYGSAYNIWMSNDLDLTNTTDRRIYDAVGEVLGIKVAYNTSSKSAYNQLCDMYYSASSAGVTCSTLTAWGYTYLEYMPVVESKYDTDAWIDYYSGGISSHTNSFSISMTELLSCVAKWMDEDKIYYDKVSGQFSLYPIHKDGPYWAYSNLYYINSQNQKMYITGLDIYHAINSYGKPHCYSHAMTVLRESNGTLTIQTKGEGHGIGISQYGAAGYANEAGWTYDQILAHYLGITNKTSWGLVGPKW